MKTKTKAVFILTLLFLFSFPVFSQNSNDISKLVTGRSYKIILFDDTEIIGKILGIDSLNVRIETGNRNIVIIPVNNILYYSTQIEPSKYNASLSFLAGVSIPTDETHEYYYSTGSHVGLNLNAALMLYMSDAKAVKIDAGYTYQKESYDSYVYANNDPAHQSTITIGNSSLFSIKFNMLLGEFSPEDKFTYYGSFGIGINLIKRGDYTSNYWQQSYPDTSKWTLSTNSISYPLEANLLFSIGSSLGYRFSKSWGIKAEIEYNLITSGNSFLFFGGRSNFPLRAGVFYVF